MHTFSPRGALMALLLAVAVSSAGLAPAFAEGPDERWVTAHAETALYAGAANDALLGLVSQWTSYRLDDPNPPQNGRLWVWNPYTRGHGWIPVAAVGPGRAPTQEEVDAFWAAQQSAGEERHLADLRRSSPRDYLYARYSDLAPLLDCIATHESGWLNVPNARGSGAFGPFQFMRGTFYSTPTGQAGGDWRNPADQVDAAAEMIALGRLREWAVVTRGLC